MRTSGALPPPAAVDHHLQLAVALQIAIGGKGRGVDLGADTSIRRAPLITSARRPPKKDTVVMVTSMLSP